MIDQRTLNRLAAICFVVTALLHPVTGISAQAVAQSSASEESPATELPVPNSETPRPIAEKPCYLMPDGLEFDSSIPSPRQFLGFEVGELHIRHHQLVAYIREVASRSDRMSLEVIGQTHGARPLLMLTVTSPGNHERIDEIREAHRALAKPEAEGSVNPAEVPAVINMGYSVHGDESSGANAVPAVVYYLAAAQGEAIEELLENVVVLIDPCLNPDGFDRFAAWANANRGRVINADPNHAEHTQPWPGGRVNYYWFDLNRDWMPGQHPESQARLRKYHEWKPNVVLDFHEMGTGTTFFFQPGVPTRNHPLTPSRNVELTRAMGEYHAAALDDIGSLYFTEEQFDDFYMGKGSSYPDLHGAVGILFEQASSRGHVQESNQGLVTFPFTIRNQFTCSLSSLQATLDMREELNAHLQSFYSESLQKGEEAEAFAYAFKADGDMTRLVTFAQMLQRHDVQCYWLKEDHQLQRTELPAGKTLVVPSAQPEFRFLLAMIERRTEFEENIFYDVSAWTLPLAFNLDSFAIREPLESDLLEPASDLDDGGARAASTSELDVADDVVAYAIPWTDYHAPRTLNRLLERGVKVRVAQKPFSGSRGDQVTEFGFGTMVISIGIQDLGRAEVFDAILESEAAEVYAIDTGLTPSGVDLGSSRFTTLKKPEVMMVVDDGVNRYEAGSIWHLLDTRVEMSVTLLRIGRLSSADLDRYNVIILAGGSYQDVSERTIEDLDRWVSDGGTLITLTSAVGWADAAELVDLEFVTESDSEPGASNNNESGAAGAEDAETGDGEAEEVKPEPIQKPYVDARDDRALSFIRGAIFRAKIDTTHPLGFGYTDSNLPVFRNTRTFMKPAENPYANPVIYHEDPLLGGYISEDNLDLLKQAASVRVVAKGSGRIILMTDDPNFRAFWYGTNRMFLNAIFFGQMIRVP